MFPSERLTRGRCYACNKVYLADREQAITKANERAVAEAARKLLTQLKGADGKTEPLRPQVLEGFMKRVGGMDKFGDIVGEQFMKCSQRDPNTGLVDPTADWKPQIAAKFAELALRTLSQEDDKQVFDPASLSDEDLQTVLKGLLVEQVSTSPEFCRALLDVVKETNPKLLQDSIDPPPVEAEQVKKIELSELGIDEKDAGE